MKILKIAVVTAGMAINFSAWSSEGTRTPSSTEHHMNMDTPEMRQKMARMHELMASCLKSNRSMNECHQEMMQNCPMMKEGKCEMHGMMGMGMKGHDHHEMTKGKKAKDK